MFSDILYSSVRSSIRFLSLILLIIMNKLMNIPYSLALLIGVQTFANPLTYLLYKSSRLAKKGDLVLLLLLLLS